MKINAGVLALVGVLATSIQQAFETGAPGDQAVAIVLAVATASYVAAKGYVAYVGADNTRVDETLDGINDAAGG